MMEENTIDMIDLEQQIKEEFILLLEEKDPSFIKKFLVFGIKHKIISLDEIPSLKIPYNNNKLSHIESSSQDDTEMDKKISSEIGFSKIRNSSSKKNNSVDIRRELIHNKPPNGTNENESDDNSLSKISTNNSTTNTANQKIPENLNNNIPLKKIIDEQFNSFCEFLRSGEVEGASYENYLLLFQDIEEYLLIEIGKQKTRKAREIYEKFITQNAPNKVRIPSDLFKKFELIFIKIDNSLFEQITPIVTNKLASVKSKFISSKYYTDVDIEKKKLEKIITTNTPSDFIGVLRDHNLKFEIKETLPEQLQYILKDEELLLRFRLFLENLFCDDTLSLWLRIEHFIKYFEEYTLEQQIDILLGYFNDYLKEGAMHQIAVGFELQEAWREIVEVQKKPSVQQIIKIITQTRSELSKDLHMHTFDFIRIAKDKSTDTRKRKPRPSSESLPEGVHAQLVRIVNNKNTYNQFESFLATKYCVENLLCWKAIEDLRAESYESKRREKAQVYFRRFLAYDSPEPICLSSELQRELYNMITNKKIFLEMKLFDVAQNQVETTLQPLVLQFFTLTQKQKQRLLKEANEKRIKQFSLLKKTNKFDSFIPIKQSSKNTHLILAKLDEEKNLKELFLTFLTEKGYKNNFLFWSEAYDMLCEVNPTKKLKHSIRLFKTYIKEGSEMGLRLKSNFKNDLSIFYSSAKVSHVSDIPHDLFTNLLIEIELSLSEVVESFWQEHEDDFSQL
eukprot:TRINITY_DN4323_c0_g1_i1.p1 TRINITY_DN4323_c0_g1~~TRINITY_DN4323_c0_g1_i1.p1  ORF type:complete len:733 (-),score=213.87 TRINITY_DN4323_c0_g1_i1:115-2313(-)